MIIEAAVPVNIKRVTLGHTMEGIEIGSVTSIRVDILLGRDRENNRGEGGGR